MIDVGADGNQVVGNLIGVLEQDATDYFQVGNGAEGVLVESSSNLIGGDVAGATNVISANQTDGIHIEGAGCAGQPGRGELHRHRHQRDVPLRPGRSR